MGSNWAALFLMACRLIDQVNAREPIIRRWTFGGGTALMLQINHRNSHDIDIFVDNPQLLGFLDPAKHDFVFDITPSAYSGDGSRFLKLAFDTIGEIDFIACAQLTDVSESKTTILGREVLLETPAEVITKKVFHRGASITPRDIFDIAATSKNYSSEIVSALSKYPSHVRRALDAIANSKAPYVEAVVADLDILPGFEVLRTRAISDCRDVLEKALLSGKNA